MGVVTHFVTQQIERYHLTMRTFDTKSIEYLKAYLFLWIFLFLLKVLKERK